MTVREHEASTSLSRWSFPGRKSGTPNAFCQLIHSHFISLTTSWCLILSCMKYLFGLWRPMALTRATWHDPQSNPQMATTRNMLGNTLRGQAVNQGQLLLVLGLGLLNQRRSHDFRPKGGWVFLVWPPWESPASVQLHHTHGRLREWPPWMTT